MKDLNSISESQVMPLEKTLKLKITTEREINIRYTGEKLEVNWKNKHLSTKEIKCVDAWQSMLK